MSTWVAGEPAWEPIWSAIESTRAFAWDTETYGHNVKETSPAYRAEVDVWSVAVRDRSWVLPAFALDHDVWQYLFANPAIQKVGHNVRHDLHALANRGVEVRGLYDTLEGARLAWPGRRSYTLKSLRVEVLGKPTRELFADITAPDIIEIPHFSTVCVCCKPGCRKKSWPHAQFPSYKPKFQKQGVTVEGIGPLHPRWARKLAYAAADAEDAFDLKAAVDERIGVLSIRLPELPW